MRHYLSLLIATLLGVSAYATDLKPVASFPKVEISWDYGKAMDHDGFTLPCSYTVVNDTDVMFTILNNDLSVLKQFTIKGVIKYKIIHEEGEEYREVISFPEHIREAEFGFYDRSCLASQTIFNNDMKWEVMIEDDSAIEDNGRYSIYNEDGEYLGAVPLSYYHYSDGSISSGYPMSYYWTNEQYYLYDEGTGTFYKADTNSGSGVSSLPATVSQAYPNPLILGETMTIEMENGVDGTFKVEVVDMKGARLYSAEKEAKNGTIKVPSVSLHKGWNIYTVKDGDEIIEKGKILVK